MLVMVEYRIRPERAQDFTLAMQAVREQRLRDGAFRSSLYRDPADPSRYLETFVVESWAEHLRLYERATVSDRIVEERARAFILGGGRRRFLTTFMLIPQMYQTITRQFSNENGQVLLDFALAAVTMVWMVRGFMEKETV